MKKQSQATEIDPEQYILSLLTPEERIDAAFEMAKHVFKKKRLSIATIEKAVQKVRRRNYETKKKQGRN
jgi:hypothetical protein